MSRKRVTRSIFRFLDSRWGFIHRLQAGAFAVFVAGIIVGISALATQAAMHVDKFTTPNSARATTTSNSSSQSELAQLSNDAQSTVAEIAIPASKKPSNTTSATTTRCDQVLHQAAKDTLYRKTKSESSRHQHVVRTLQNTGLITRFLNPNMYGYRMANEAQRHHSALTLIQSQYSRDLASAHCKE